jgi:hypothetical protein
VTTAGSVVNFPSITTTVDTALVFVAAVAQQNSGPPTFSAWTNGFVEQNDFIESKVSFTSAYRLAGAPGSYTTSTTVSGASAMRAHILAFGRLPTPVKHLVVTAGVRQNLVMFVPSTPMTHALVLGKTGNCSFSASPLGSETAGTAVGNAVVLFNEASAADLAPMDVTVEGSTTTVAYQASTSRLTHTSLTAGTPYCYKVIARNGLALDDDSGAGRPSQAGIPTAGATTDPLFVSSFGAASLSAPSVVAGRGVYFVSGTGTAFSLGVDGTGLFPPYSLTGGVQNRSPVGTLTGDPGATLFVSSLNGDAFALWATGPSAGSLRWSSGDIDGDIGAAGDQPLGDALYAAPVVSNALSRVFVPTRNLTGTTNRVFALNTRSGACVWAFNGTCDGATGSDEVGQISAMPMLDSLNNRLFFTSTKLLSGPTLWALDANDTPAGSRLLWSREVGDSDSSLSFATTALTGLYVGTNAGRIYKLTSSSGLTCWGSTSNGCGGAATGDEQFFCADPAVDARATTCANGAAVQKGLSVVFGGPYDGHAIFTTADGNVRMIDGNGVQRWRTHISGASAPLPLRSVGSGVLYVGGNDGLVHELSMATGAQIATRNVGGGEVVAGDPSYDTIARKLYVTTSQGKLYAFNAPF